jgi:hypothetical protein
LIGSHRRIGRLGTLTIAALGAAAFLAGQAPQTAAASEPAATESAATAVVRAAKAYLGAPYQHGGTGPSRFDCSGLVYRAFADVGLASRIGGLQSAAGLYHWFSVRHLASRTSPQLGDLVIWGGGAHVGIYVGNGRAISALTDGVRIAPVSAVLSGFTAYLHTHLTTLRVPIAGATRVAPFVTYVRYVTFQASLRVAPDTSQRLIAYLYRGTRLTVIGSRYVAHRLWLNVRTAGGEVGWVANSLTRSDQRAAARPLTLPPSLNP